MIDVKKIDEALVKLKEAKNIEALGKNIKAAKSLLIKFTGQQYFLVAGKLQLEINEAFAQDLSDAINATMEKQIAKKSAEAMAVLNAAAESMKGTGN